MFYRIYCNFFFIRYPAEWGGTVDGKAFVSNLDEFGKRVFNQVKNAVEMLFDSQEVSILSLFNFCLNLWILEIVIQCVIK